MSFRIRKKESAKAGVTRIFKEELEPALKHLQRVARGNFSAIHSARKQIKKARSLLALARPVMGHEAKAANVLLRDAAAPIGSARDAQVVVEVLNKLIQQDSRRFHTPLTAGVRACLVSRQAKLRGQRQEIKKAVEQSIGKIGKALRVVRRCAFRAKGFDAFEAGLKRSYDRGAEAMKTAFSRPTDDHFHEWRKEVKHHWHHVRLLRGIWPQAMRNRADELKVLADVLGEDHDLAVIRRIVTEECATADRKPTGVLLQAIADRQNALRRVAHTLGAQIYAESGRHLAARFKSYWDAWHSAKAKREEVLGVDIAADIAISGPLRRDANSRAVHRP